MGLDRHTATSEERLAVRFGERNTMSRSELEYPTTLTATWLRPQGYPGLSVLDRACPRLAGFDPA
jgi:hypothetical protein